MKHGKVFLLFRKYPWIPLSSRQGGLKGMISRDEIGFASDDESVSEFIDFGIEQALGYTHKHLISY